MVIRRVIDSDEIRSFIFLPRTPGLRLTPNGANRPVLERRSNQLRVIEFDVSRASLELGCLGVLPELYTQIDENIGWLHL